MKELSEYSTAIQNVVRSWVNSFHIEGASTTDLKWVGSKHLQIAGKIEKRFDKLTTKKLYLYALATILKDMGKIEMSDKYRQMYNHLTSRIEEEDEKQKLSPEEKEKWLPFEDLVTLRGELEKDSKNTLGDNLKYLVVCMYTLQPPIRNEYNTMKIGSGGEEENFILCPKKGSCIIHLNKYKTIKHHGKKELVLSKELSDIIRESLKLFPRDYLFGTDVPMGTNKYIRLMKSLIPHRNLGCDIFRSAYITHVYAQNPPWKIREELADKMCNTVKTASVSYWKIAED